MNKKEAVAYAQVTLNFMQSSKYTGELNAETLGLEMRQAFKLYPRNLIQSIAHAQIESEKDLKNLQNGCDANG